MPPKAEDDCDQEILGINEDFRENWLDYHEDKLQDHREKFFRKDCFYCRNVFPTALQCYNHERFCKDGSTRRFTCQECSINFSMKKYLVRHQERHKDPGSFFCFSCDAQFTNSTARMQHRIANHRIFQCHICLVRCKDAMLYVAHILTTHSSQLNENEKDESKSEELLNVVDPLNLKREPSTEELFVANIDEVVVPKDEEKSPEIEPNPETKKEEDDLSDYQDNDNWGQGVDSGSESEQKVKSEEERSVPQPAAVSKKPKRKRKRRTIHGDKELDYECKRCGKQFLYPQKMIMHCRRLHKMNSDDEDWPQEAGDVTNKLFYCENCHRTYKTESSFKNHMRIKHGIIPKLPRGRKEQIISKEKQEKRKENESNGSYSCEECTKTFPSEKYLKIHKKVHEEKPFSCTHCEKKFRRKSQMTMHIQNDHRKLRTYNCHRCAHTFTVEKCFVKHLKATHGIEIQMERIDCKFCKKIFYEEKSLEVHIKRTHMINGKAQIKCKFCDEYFDDRQLMEDHKTAAHKDKLTCTQCEKSFKNESCLRAHVKLLHLKQKITKTMYLCGKCGKNFQCRRTHADHERSNCGKSYLYECEQCHKHFVSPATLRSHKVTHSDVKAFSCRFCKKSFKTKAEVVVHERSHTGEKPYQCTFCPKAFAHRESLKTHLTVHTGFKRFMCSGCGKRFTCISNLQAHRRSHADTCGLVPNCTKTMGPMEGPLNSKEKDQNEMF
ncbi:oocyte zinc finger protein XlCOF6-like [Lutzomyia longipalpis]|nr:oocyte zinc finger protein XlCOF6-like [Lutzomyia longipalpis]